MTIYLVTCMMWIVGFELRPLLHFDEDGCLGVELINALYWIMLINWNVRLFTRYVMRADLFVRMLF